MTRVRPCLPFSIQLPAHCRFKLANHIPDFDRANRVTANERESGKEVEAKDLVPKLGSWVVRVGDSNGFLRRRAGLKLGSSQGKYLRKGTLTGRRTVDVICNLPNLANFVKNTGSREM